MNRVLVGMSGGVDSAVTAYLLKAAGYDVMGITLKNWESVDGEPGRCCEIDAAQLVAKQLDIPYYVHRALEPFSKYVTEPFVCEYLEGRTPNPCVECNRYVKWAGMMEAAGFLGADYIATGHYANIVRLENGRFTVKQAKSVAKDQTYMLYKLTQEQLARTLMPLGNFDKAEVRRIAEAAGIGVANKPDSQEICFIPDGNYADYIEYQAGTPEPGNFVDESGKVLGKHKGIIHYTIGQRKGLGIALGAPVFVKAINVKDNEVVLAPEEALFSSEMFVNDVNFMSIPGLEKGESLRAKVRIRYHHAGEYAMITREDGETLRVTFENPVRAISPGQSAVFYDDEMQLVGGGKIM